jgi:hypothetical protein
MRFSVHTGVNSANEPKNLQDDCQENDEGSLFPHAAACDRAQLRSARARRDLLPMVRKLLLRRRQQLWLLHHRTMPGNGQWHRRILRSKSVLYAALAKTGEAFAQAGQADENCSIRWRLFALCYPWKPWRLNPANAYDPQQYARERRMNAGRARNVAAQASHDCAHPTKSGINRDQWAVAARACHLSQVINFSPSRS